MREARNSPSNFVTHITLLGAVAGFRQMRTPFRRRASRPIVRNIDTRFRRVIASRPDAVDELFRRLPCVQLVCARLLIIRTFSSRAFRERSPARPSRNVRLTSRKAVVGDVSAPAKSLCRRFRPLVRPSAVGSVRAAPAPAAASLLGMHTGQWTAW